MAINLAISVVDSVPPSRSPDGPSLLNSGKNGRCPRPMRGSPSNRDGASRSIKSKRGRPAKTVGGSTRRACAGECRGCCKRSLTRDCGSGAETSDERAASVSHQRAIAERHDGWRWNPACWLLACPAAVGRDDTCDNPVLSAGAGGRGGRGGGPARTTSSMGTQRAHLRRIHPQKRVGRSSVTAPRLLYF